MQVEYPCEEVDPLQASQAGVEHGEVVAVPVACIVKYKLIALLRASVLPEAIKANYNTSSNSCSAGRLSMGMAK